MGFGWLWWVSVGCGGFRLIVMGCDGLRWVAVDCGRFRLVVVGFGWLL